MSAPKKPHVFLIPKNIQAQTRNSDVPADHPGRMPSKLSGLVLPLAVSPAPAADERPGPEISIHSGRSDVAHFLETVRGFTGSGRKTEETLTGGIPYFTNAFWNGRQKVAHRLHEISYRASFKPELPQFFIEGLTGRGDRVFDPFMGRGTVPLQAALMGRQAYGSDINPLSVLLARPRIRPVSKCWPASLECWSRLHWPTRWRARSGPC